MDKQFDKLNKLLAKSSQLKNNYVQSIKDNDFDGFVKNFQLYIKQSYPNKKDEPNNEAIGSIKEFLDKVPALPEHQQTLISFFEKAELISQQNMMLCFWMQRDNEPGPFSHMNTPSTNHIQFWEKGICVDRTHYEGFCSVTNNDKFLQNMEEFLALQRNYRITFVLDNEINPNSKNIKRKI